MSTTLTNNSNNDAVITDDIESQTKYITNNVSTVLVPQLLKSEQSPSASPEVNGTSLAQHPETAATVAALVQSSSPPARPSTKAPKDTLKAVYKVGEYKAALTLDLLMIQSFMAGVYIAMAGQVYLTVEGGVLGAALFPTGLIAVVLTSAELFTGDALVFIASVLGKRVSIKSMLRNWTVSWIFNFLGCLAWAFVLAYESNAIEDKGMKEFAITVATKKAHQTWGRVFAKGIGANFMVCLGVWQATCAEEAAGKMLGLWFPVASFVICGFEHCIADQFFVPCGMMFGADISVKHLLWNVLVPATLGNVVGGGIFMGAVYWYVFDSMSHSLHVYSTIRQAMVSTVNRRQLDRAESSFKSD